MSVEAVRMFFGCALPRDIGAKLLDTVGGLAEGRSTLIEDLHLTLVFLGVQPRERIEAARRVGESLAGSPGFVLKLDRLGAFARSGAVWASSAEPAAGLFTLQTRLADALAREGFAIEDADYRPHVTLLRSAKPPRALPVLGPLNWPVGGFALFESRLDALGPRYSPLGEWRLGDDQTQRLPTSSSHSSLGVNRV